MASAFGGKLQLAAQSIAVGLGLQTSQLSPPAPLAPLPPLPPPQPNVLGTHPSARQEALELIDIPDSILRLPSFLRTTTGDREGLAALAAQSGGPSALVRSITAEMQVGVFMCWGATWVWNGAG